MAAPSMTLAALGNVANAVALAAAGTDTYNIYPGATGTGNVAIPTSTVYETQIEIKVVAGATVSTTNGFTVSCYAGSGNGAPPDFETVPSVSYSSGNIAASGTAARKLFLQTSPGWRISVTNNDGTNAVASLTITADTFSGIA